MKPTKAPAISIFCSVSPRFKSEDFRNIFQFRLRLQAVRQAWRKSGWALPVEQSGRITDVPVNTDLPVHTAWDISPGARTRIETLVTLGRKPELAPNEDLMEGVNAGRKTIPFARFDAKRCAQGLESLRAYRTEWDEKARAFKKTPDHNWASYGADAWRYLSLSWRAPMRKPEPEKIPVGIPLPDLTMDQFMDLEDGWSRREERV